MDFAFFEIFKIHLIHKIVMYIYHEFVVCSEIFSQQLLFFFKPIWNLHDHVFLMFHRDVLIINIMVTTIYHLMYGYL